MKTLNLLVALLFVLTPLAIIPSDAQIIPACGPDETPVVDGCAPIALPPEVPGDAANCGPVGGDPLYDALCAFAFQLETVTMGQFYAVDFGLDYDEDGRIDIVGIHSDTASPPRGCTDYPGGTCEDMTGVPYNAWTYPYFQCADGAEPRVSDAGDGWGDWICEGPGNAAWTYLQLDLFYTPPDGHYGASGLPIDYVAGTEDFDVYVTGVMTYYHGRQADPSGYLLASPIIWGSDDATGHVYRLTNHYGTPRDEVGTLTGYLGLYVPDLSEDSANGYGACVVCIQPSTLRVASQAGPATHESVNGAPETVGLLQVNSQTGAFVLDVDTIDPATSTEVAAVDSILEASLDGTYVDETATQALLGVPIHRTDFNFVDGKPFDMSLLHVKWPGDRGSPVDLTGSYTKYSNLDDDPSTDIEELLCTGQATNPTNAAAHCNDWDGDGISNSDEQVDGTDPRAPNVVLDLDWTVVPDANGVEAPYVPQVQYDCRGEVKSIALQRSVDGGAWTTLSTRSDDDAKCGGVEGLDFGNNAKVGNSQDGPITVDLRLVAINVVDVAFASPTLSFLIVGNEAPTGTYTVTCLAPATGTCTDGGHTARRVTYQHTFTLLTNGGPTEAHQTVTVVLHDGIDRNAGGAGLKPPTLTHQGGGVYTYTESDINFGYPEGAVRSTSLEVTDSGGAVLVPSLTASIDVPQRKETAAVLTHTPATELIEDAAGGIEVRVAVQDVDDHDTTNFDVTLLWRQDNDAYNEVSMSPLVCNGGSRAFAREDLGRCPGVFISGEDPGTASPIGFYGFFSPGPGTVEYYFHADNPDADDNAWDDQETFLGADDPYTYEASGGPAAPGGQGVPDPLDYVIGNCNLLADILAAAQGQPLCARNLDAENYGVTLPGDDEDPFDTDGNGDVQDSNDQIDIIERNFFYYNPDEAEPDPNDDMSGTEGFTIHVWENRGVQTPEKKDYSLHVGDVSATEATEVVVFVDRTPDDNDEEEERASYRVHCIVASDGRNAYYRHAGDWSPATGCGQRHSWLANEGNAVGEYLGRGAWTRFYGACTATPVNTAEPLQDQENCPPLLQFVDEDRDNVPEEVLITTPSDACLARFQAVPPPTGPPCQSGEFDQEPVPLGGVPEVDPNTLCEDPETQSFPDCVGGEDPTGPAVAIIEGALCTVDPTICSEPAPDADGDGVPDESDQCSGTPEGERVDADGCSDSQGGNPPVEEGCEGIEVPVVGECLPDPTQEQPSLDDLCPDGGSFPECLGTDPFPALEEALEISQCPTPLPTDGGAVFICRKADSEDTLLSSATGGTWPGYTVRIGGVFTFHV